jgi:hypothetical protein
MPFKSNKQRRWMFKNKPKMACEWAHEGDKAAKQQCLIKLLRKKKKR